MVNVDLYSAIITKVSNALLWISSGTLRSVVEYGLPFLLAYLLSSPLVAPLSTASSRAGCDKLSSGARSGGADGCDDTMATLGHALQDRRLLVAHLADTNRHFILQPARRVDCSRH